MSTPDLVIQTKGLTKRFGAKEVLHGVDLEVRAGETYGFLGPNGAGKTTTISCLMDFIRPTSGSITILGLDAQAQSTELKRLIGYLPSDPQLYANLTGHQHLRLYESIFGPNPASLKTADQLGLDLSAKAKVLSTGNKQKLAITLALVSQPKLLILDEPTQGLDPLLQDQFYAILRHFRSTGGTVFISSHNLDEVQKICDRVGVIKDGQLVASESLASIRDLAVHEVTVELRDAFKPADFATDTIEVVSHAKTRLHLRVRGDLDPLIARLAKHHVKDLEVTHATLEEVFMRYYRRDK